MAPASCAQTRLDIVQHARAAIEIPFAIAVPADIIGLWPVTGITTLVAEVGSMPPHQLPVLFQSDVNPNHVPEVVTFTGKVLAGLAVQV